MLLGALLFISAGVKPTNQLRRIIQSIQNRYLEILYTKYIGFRCKDAFSIEKRGEEMLCTRSNFAFVQTLPVPFFYSAFSHV